MASEHPINVTLKAGTGYDAPWITVGGSSPDEVRQRLDALGQVGVLSSAVAAARFFQATLAADEGGLPATPAAAAAPAPTPAAQPAPPPQPQTAWSQPAQQQAPSNQSPTGAACEQCGQPLEYKKTTGGKAVWRCPDWRWNSGNPNGHTSNFA